MCIRDSGWVAHEFELQLEQGQPVRVEKVVIVGTSRDRAIASPAMAVTTWMQRLADPAELEAAREREWQILWDEFAVRMRTSELIPQDLPLSLARSLELGRVGQPLHPGRHRHGR